MALIVVRHGKTILLEQYKNLKEEGVPTKPENIDQFYKIANIYESNSDSHLSKKGKEEAAQIGKRLIQEGFAIDRVFISPTKRTEETYDIISREFEKNGIIFPNSKKDQRISIIESGILHGIKGDASDNDIISFFNQENKEVLKGKQFANAYGTGETILQAAQRIYNFLDDTKGIWKKKNMLIITHKSTMRVVHSYFNHDLDNTAFFKCEPKNGDIIIYGELFREGMTPKKEFEIKFRNFVSGIPVDKSKRLSIFFGDLAKKGIQSLASRTTEDKENNGIEL